MRVEVLGCSGGIGGAGFLTTSLRVDEDILIDCGTGVGRLPLDDLKRIEHVFITHAHLDHIALLPMLIDTVGDLRSAPIVLHATEETLSVLRAHIFNWSVWPDFTLIPGNGSPMLKMQAIRSGEPIILGERRITPIPALHTVPAVGYVMDAGGASLAFSGDTTVSDAQIAALNGIADLRYLLVEAAFPEAHRDLAQAACHLSPGMLHEVLERLTVSPEVFITHLKPGYAQEISREINSFQGRFKLNVLHAGKCFEL